MKTILVLLISIFVFAYGYSDTDSWQSFREMIKNPENMDEYVRNVEKYLSEQFPTNFEKKYFNAGVDSAPGVTSWRDSAEENKDGQNQGGRLIIKGSLIDPTFHKSTGVGSVPPRISWSDSEEANEDDKNQDGRIIVKGKIINPTYYKK